MSKKFSYCGKCYTEEKNFEDISFEDESDEHHSCCPICKTDLYLTESDVLPVKQQPAPLIVSVGKKKFDLNEWEEKKELAQAIQDAKLDDYIKDFAKDGKETAERNYFKTANNA